MVRRDPGQSSSLFAAVNSREHILERRLAHAAARRSRCRAPRASVMSSATVAADGRSSGTARLVRVARQFLDARHPREPLAVERLRRSSVTPTGSAVDRATSSRGVPVATMRPRSMIAMRSQSASASFDVVRREQHGVAVLFHLRDLGVQLAPRLRIQPGRRLVEEHELGLVDERQRQREPLPLTARQACRTARPPFRRQREALEQRRRLARVRGRTTPNSASASRGVILSCSAVVCSAAPIFCLTSCGRRRASIPQTSIVAVVGLAQADDAFDASSSCPRRSARAARRSRRPRSRSSRPARPRRRRSASRRSRTMTLDGSSAFPSVDDGFAQVEAERALGDDDDRRALQPLVDRPPHPAGRRRRRPRVNVAVVCLS